MNTIFKYNANTKYSTKDLKGGYNSNNFSLLDIHLDEKGSSLKIQLPDIFKDHHIVAQASPTKVGYDEWPLSLALWRKFYNSHGKYKPELNEYFNMYRCQLNFAMFCVTSALGIFWQHLNHPNLLVRAVYRFHMYFHVRLILHDLGISLPHENGFSKVKNAYIKSAYYSICRYVRTYVYLLLTSQVQARSGMVGNSASGVDPQQVFKSTFKALINEDYTIGIDIERYQGVLEYALSKVDFSVGTGIYMLPSNLNLNIGKTKGYNNKILVSNTDMRTGSIRAINRDHKKLPVVKPDVPKKIVILATQHDPAGATRSHNLKMLNEKHNDEKLAITLLIMVAGLLAYHFW